MIKSAPTPNADPYSSQALAWYLLGILVIANVLSFVDRQILVLLVEPLRQDLHVGDTEISLLQGFAFTILYSVLGLPLGRYADRHNRRNLIVCGIAIWSAMTMACGMAQTMGQLFIARIGVGIGEATLAPAAYSMICDAFRPQKRGTALGVYSSAIFMGIGVSIVLGGFVMAMIHDAAEVTLPIVGVVRSWQAAFLCVGAPGFVVALLILTIAEPTRKNLAGCRLGGVTLKDAFGYLSRHRLAFTLQLIGYSCFALAAYGLGCWMPTFFIRIHHWSASQAGIYYGASVTILGTLGGILGGVLGDRWLSAGRGDARLILSVVGALCWIPFILIAVYLPSAWGALATIGLAVGFSSFVNGLGPTTVHDIVPGWLRGQATALFFFVINYHDKSAQVYIRPSGGPPNVMTGQLGTYQLVYPQDISAYGVSFSRTLDLVNLAGEVSTRFNTPLISTSQTVTPGTAADNDDNPLYAVGESLHAQVSAFWSVPRTPLFREATLLAEVAWNRRLKITKNEAALDPNTDRDAWGLRFVFTPTYRQVLPGLDIGIPLGLGYNPQGRSSVVAAFNNSGADEGGDMSMGLNFTYLNAWKANLRYTHYFGSAGNFLDDTNARSFDMNLKDRDFVSIAISRTF